MRAEECANTQHARQRAQSSPAAGLPSVSSTPAHPRVASTRVPKQHLPAPVNVISDVVRHGRSWQIIIGAFRRMWGCGRRCCRLGGWRGGARRPARAPRSSACALERPPAVPGANLPRANRVPGPTGIPCAPGAARALSQRHATPARPVGGLAARSERSDRSRHRKARQGAPPSAGTRISHTSLAPARAAGLATRRSAPREEAAPLVNPHGGGPRPAAARSRRARAFAARSVCAPRAARMRRACATCRCQRRLISARTRQLAIGMGPSTKTMW